MGDPHQEYLHLKMHVEKWREKPKESNNRISGISVRCRIEPYFEFSVLLCKVVPWNLEMAPKAMGISGHSCQAESPPSYGRLGLQEEPLGPSAGQKENGMGEGCFGEVGWTSQV